MDQMFCQQLTDARKTSALQIKLTEKKYKPYFWKPDIKPHEASAISRHCSKQKSIWNRIQFFFEWVFFSDLQNSKVILHCYWKVKLRKNKWRVNKMYFEANENKGSLENGHFNDLFGGRGAQTCSGLCHLKPFILLLSSNLCCASNGCPIRYFCLSSVCREFQRTI